VKAKQDSAGDEPEGPAEDPELVRGRQQSMAILVTLAGSVVTVAFLGGAPLSGMFIQLIVLALLGVQIFRGTPWARWVLAAMITLAAVGNGYNAVGSFGAEGIGWIVNGCLAAIYAWCAFMLAFSSAVTAFMLAQRKARESARI